MVKAVGNAVRGFEAGDEVYYAGVINRQGSYAQLQAVDSRIAAQKPRTLDFAQAAALPLTALTAWETLFDRLDVNKPVAGGSRALLLVGGAGGVGSIAVQLLKTLTDIQIIATASRPESEAWLRSLGADFVINHHHSLPEQVEKLGIGAPSWAFSTSHTEHYLPQLAELLAPQGRIALIDDPAALDANPLKGKSISLHWEFMFTRPLRETADIARQGEILAKVAQLVDEGRLKTTATHIIDGINAANLRRAHQMVERGDMVGKVVLVGW